MALFVTLKGSDLPGLDQKVLKTRFTVTKQFVSSSNKVLHGIAFFEGHGGSQAAEYANKVLLDIIFSKIEDQKLSIEKAIRLGFRELQKEMTEEWTNSWPLDVEGHRSTAGTSATVAIIEDMNLVIGHVGDTAAYLFGNEENNEIQRLTVEHTPDNPKERLRISRVTRDGIKYVFMKVGTRVIYEPKVVWDQAECLCRPNNKRLKHDNLTIPLRSVTRSLGDFWSYRISEDKKLISHEPQIVSTSIDLQTNQFLVFCTKLVSKNTNELHSCLENQQNLWNAGIQESLTKFCGDIYLTSTISFLVLDLCRLTSGQFFLKKHSESAIEAKNGKVLFVSASENHENIYVSPKSISESLALDQQLLEKLGELAKLREKQDQLPECEEIAYNDYNDCGNYNEDEVDVDGKEKDGDDTNNQALQTSVTQVGLPETPKIHSPSDTIGGSPRDKSLIAETDNKFFANTDEIQNKPYIFEYEGTDTETDDGGIICELDIEVEYFEEEKDKKSVLTSRSNSNSPTMSLVSDMAAVISNAEIDDEEIESLNKLEMPTPVEQVYAEKSDVQTEADTDTGKDDNEDRQLGDFTIDSSSQMEIFTTVEKVFAEKAVAKEETKTDISKDDNEKGQYARIEIRRNNCDKSVSSPSSKPSCSSLGSRSDSSSSSSDTQSIDYSAENADIPSRPYLESIHSHILAPDCIESIIPESFPPPSSSTESVEMNIEPIPANEGLGEISTVLLEAISSILDDDYNPDVNSSLNSHSEPLPSTSSTGAILAALEDNQAASTLEKIMEIDADNDNEKSTLSISKFQENRYVFSPPPPAPPKKRRGRKKKFQSKEEERAELQKKKLEKERERLMARSRRLSLKAIEKMNQPKKRRGRPPLKDRSERPQKTGPRRIRRRFHGPRKPRRPRGMKSPPKSPLPEREPLIPNQFVMKSSTSELFKGLDMSFLNKDFLTEAWTLKTTPTSAPLALDTPVTNNFSFDTKIKTAAFSTNSGNMPMIIENESKPLSKTISSTEAKVITVLPNTSLKEDKPYNAFAPEVIFSSTFASKAPVVLDSLSCTPDTTELDQHKTRRLSTPTPKMDNENLEFPSTSELTCSTVSEGSGSKESNSNQSKNGIVSTLSVQSATSLEHEWMTDFSDKIWTDIMP